MGNRLYASGPEDVLGAVAVEFFDDVVRPNSEERGDLLFQRSKLQVRPFVLRYQAIGDHIAKIVPGSGVGVLRPSTATECVALGKNISL